MCGVEPCRTLLTVPVTLTVLGDEHNCGPYRIDSFGASRYFHSVVSPFMFTVNGEPCTREGPLTVQTLLEQLGLRPEGVAIALNLDVVPRARWPQTWLHDGDSVEIVHMVGGG